MKIKCVSTNGFVGFTKNKIYDVLKVTHEDEYEFIDDNGNIRRFRKPLFVEL